MALTHEITLRNVKDDAGKKAVGDQLNALVTRIRNRRLFQVEVWLKNYAAWRGTYTRSFYRSDVFNHYVPAFRKTVEKFVINTAQMVVPTNEFFEVFPLDTLDEETGKAAESVNQYMLYLMRKRIKIYTLVKELVRTYSLYGRAITKQHVKVENDKVWPHSRSVDPFMFTVWPETVATLEQAMLVVEDAIMPYEQYNSMAQTAKAEIVGRDALASVSWPHYIVRRLQQSGIASPPSEAVGSSAVSGTVSTQSLDTASPGQGYDWVYMSEVWVNEGDYWRYCWVIWNLNAGPKVVKISDKKFARPNYRWTVARKAPGEQYTTSQADDLEPLQILFNDQVNMFMEAQAIGFAPPVAVDPNLVTRTGSLVFRPRAKWLVPPTGVKVLENTADQSQRTALSGMQFTMGLMDQYSGSSGLAQGQTQRNLPRAGFAVSSLLSLSLSDVRDVAREIEDEILTPMLQDLYDLTVEYVPSAQVFKIPGTRDFPIGARLTTKDLEGDFEFNWTGSLQSQEYQQRAQRLTQFLQAFGGIAQFVVPQMSQQGYQMNWIGLMKRIWRDGLGERGADTLIRKMTQEEIQQMQQQQAAAQAQGGQGQQGAGGAPGGAGFNPQDLQALITQLSQGNPNQEGGGM